MSIQYFLVDGTMQELHNIAHERKIDPRSIRLILDISRIQGYRDGEIIFGQTGITRDLTDVLAYAETHGIKIP